MLCGLSILWPGTSTSLASSSGDPRSVCECVIFVHGTYLFSGPYDIAATLSNKQVRMHACSRTIIVLHRDYAHPNWMLESSYRWNGLNFENSSFASKLSPPRFASKLRPLMKKLSIFCLHLSLPALEIQWIHLYNNSNAWVKVARYKEKYTNQDSGCSLSLSESSPITALTTSYTLYLQIGDNQLKQEGVKPFLDNCSLTNASLPGGRILEAN